MWYLYLSHSVVRMIKLKIMRWEGHVAYMGERRGVYKVLVGKPEGKRPLERMRHRWEDNFNMNHQEVGCGDMNWIEWMKHKMASWNWTHRHPNILHTALPDMSGTSSWNLEMSVPGTVFWITLVYSCNIHTYIHTYTHTHTHTHTHIFIRSSNSSLHHCLRNMEHVSMTII